MIYIARSVVSFLWLCHSHYVMGTRLCELSEPHSGIKYNTGSTSVGGHTGRSPLATVYACTISRRLIPSKIWMPTNQITAIPAWAHVSSKLYAHAPGHLGVYKEGQVAYW